MGERGTSLAELLTALAIGAILVAISAPSLDQIRARARLSGGCAEISGTLGMARSRAVSEGRSIGICFARGDTGWRYQMFADGDGDGIRTADIDAGIDPPLGPPGALSRTWQGLDFGALPLARMKRVPPGTGWVAPPSDPLQFGGSTIVSFSPLGDSSSGSLYLSDGHSQMGVVVLYGPTGRIRIYRYDVAKEEWNA